MKELFSASRILIFDRPMDRTTLLWALAASLASSGRVAPEFAERILARERQFPTGIDMETHSIALPHTESEWVKESGFALGINRAGVPFHRSDDPKTVVKPRLVVMMALTEDLQKVTVIERLFALLGDIHQLNSLLALTPQAMAQRLNVTLASTGSR